MYRGIHHHVPPPKPSVTTNIPRWSDIHRGSYMFVPSVPRFWQPQMAAILDPAEHTPGGADDGDVDELLRVVSVVREGSIDAIYDGGTGEPRTGFEAQGAGATPLGVVVRDIYSTPSTQDENISSGLSVSGAKRRRCGTVCLAGASTQRGFCASSLSRW